MGVDVSVGSRRERKIPKKNKPRTCFVLLPRVASKKIASNARSDTSSPASLLASAQDIPFGVKRRFPTVASRCSIRRGLYSPELLSRVFSARCTT